MACVVADRPEDRVDGLDALPGALRQSEKYLHGNGGDEPGAADLPGAGDGRLGQPPGLLVWAVAGPAKAPQPLQVGIAVDVAAGRELARAGRHRADAMAGQRGDISPGDEGSDARAKALLMPEILTPYRPPPFHPPALPPPHLPPPAPHPNP